MRWVSLALMVSLCACVTPLAQESHAQSVPWQGPISPEQSDLSTIGVGYCRSDSGLTDLRRMMVLENQQIDVTGDQGRPLRVGLQGESVSFERLDGDRSRWVFNIGHIAGGEEYLDVELKLALVEDQLAVYWRETYQHRIYRQGLLRIVGDGLVRRCEGRGGLSSSPGIIDRTTLE